MRPYALPAAVLILAIAWSLPSVADEGRVFACNYTVSLTMDGDSFVITQQSRVRDGSHIPVDGQDVRLRMKFSAEGQDRVRIELILLERSGSSWIPIYPKPLSFEATHGEPIEFSYEDDIAAIDIAMIVSPMSD